MHTGQQLQYKSISALASKCTHVHVSRLQHKNYSHKRGQITKNNSQMALDLNGNNILSVIVHFQVNDSDRCYCCNP